MKYLVIFIFIAFCGCQQRTSERHTVFGHDFRKAKSLFPDSLTNHFPSDFNRNGANFSISHPTKNTELKLIVTDVLPNDVIDTLILHYSELSIDKYNSNDSCLLVINRYAHLTSQGNLYNQYSEKMSRSENCPNGYFPIPNFYRLESHTRRTPSQLNESYIHYVISANQLKGNQQSQQNWERYLPLNWEDGYSSGLSISSSENRIIYWVIMW